MTGFESGVGGEIQENEVNRRRKIANKEGVFVL